MFKVVLFYLFLLLCGSDAARILAHYPTPFISHQAVFRPLTLELVKRGHDVVVITTDPIFAKGESPPNLQEIDVHDISYTLWKEAQIELKNNINRSTFDTLLKLMIIFIEKQLNTPEVQKILNDKSKTFDLVIAEAHAEGALGFAHHFKAPVIQFSSLVAAAYTLKVYGTPINPLVYPNSLQDRLYNLTMMEKLHEIYQEYNCEKIFYDNVDFTDLFLKKVFGPETPSYLELRKNVDMLFLNVHAVWDFNRPVPPNVVYLGGIHQNPQKDLPQDLQAYLDSSKNGVIYVSFGSNIDPALFSAKKIQTFVNVFSKQPYDVLWKWNYDELPGRTENIKISKWMPQSDLLRHPNVKLFITQGGLQSTDEAITAGVPLVGIPVFGDQNFNVEQYLYFRIGERVKLDTMTVENLSAAINKVLQDNSYRENVVKLRTIMNDQPHTPIERAVWWTEYVIRHKGAKHLRSPAANMSIAQYYELELLSYVVLGLIAVISLFVSAVYIVCSKVFKRSVKVKTK